LGIFKNTKIGIFAYSFWDFGQRLAWHGCLLQPAEKYNAVHSQPQAESTATTIAAAAASEEGTIAAG